MRLRNHQRGTSSFYSDSISHRRFEKKNEVTRFSNSRDGVKILTNKGTRSMWISKKSFTGIPYENHILVVNRGTQRLIK